MFLVHYSFNENSVEQHKENKTINWQRLSLSNTIFLSPAELLFKWKLVSMQQA